MDGEGNWFFFPRRTVLIGKSIVKHNRRRRRTTDPGERLRIVEFPRVADVFEFSIAFRWGGGETLRRNRLASVTRTPSGVCKRVRNGTRSRVCCRTDAKNVYARHIRRDKKTLDDKSTFSAGRDDRPRRTRDVREQSNVYRNVLGRYNTVVSTRFPHSVRLFKRFRRQIGSKFLFRFFFFFKPLFREKNKTVHQDGFADSERPADRKTVLFLCPIY